MKVSTKKLMRQADGLAVEFSKAGKRGLSRRDVLTYGSWAATLFGVAGTAFLDGIANDTFAQSVTGKSGNAVLTYMYVSGPEQEYDRMFAAEYLKQHPEIDDIVFDVFSYDEGFQKQTLALSRGDTTIDLMTIDEPWLPSHANAGYLYNMRDEFTHIADPNYDWDDFHPAGVGATVWNNQQYGIPHWANTLGLIYRKDLYEEAGLKLPTPESKWSDFEAALKVLHRPDRIQFGFASVHQRGDLNTTDWMTYAHSWLPYPHNQFYDESSWQPRMNEAFGPESIELYVNLLNNYAIPGSLGVDWDHFVAQYQQGQIAHLIFWSSYWGMIEDPRVSKVIAKNGWSTPYAGEHGFAASHRGYWVLGMNKASRHAEFAYKFAEHMTSKDTYKRSALKGLLFGRKSLYSDPDVLAKFPYYGQQQQNLDAIVKQRAYRPRLPQFAKLNEVLNVNLAAASAGEITAKAATDRMASDSARLLKRWGYLKG